VVNILTRRAGAKIYRTIGALARRYEKHPKTIDRWAHEGVRVGDEIVPLPPADLVVNGVRHWEDPTLDAFDAGIKAAMLRQRGAA
jgi:hypothetical protein